MPRTVRAISAARGPGQSAEGRLGNVRLAQQALAAVKERAPDERLALAFLPSSPKIPPPH